MSTEIASLSEPNHARLELPTVTIGVIIRAIAAFAFSKLIAISLGPTEFARYGHFYILAAYLTTASSLGLGSALTVYVGREWESFGSREVRVGSVVFLACCLGAFVGLLICLSLTASVGGSWLPESSSGWLLILWLLFCTLAAIATAFQSVLLGEQRHNLYQTIAVVIPVLSCGVLLCYSLLHRVTAETGIACYMAGYLFPLLVFFGSVRPVPKISYNHIKATVRFLTPYILPSLLIPTIGTVSVLSLRYLVAHSVAANELGLWQALWRLSESYMGVLISIGTALFLPRFARLRDRTQAKRQLLFGMLILVGLYLPVASCFLVAPDLSLRLLLSREYTGIAPLLPLQIVGDILKLLCFVQGLLFTALLRPRLTLVSEASFSVLIVIFAFVLTPHLQTLGAVIAYSGAYLLLAILLLPLTRWCLHRMPEYTSLDSRVSVGTTQADSAAV